MVCNFIACPLINVILDLDVSFNVSFYVIHLRMTQVVALIIRTAKINVQSNLEHMDHCKPLVETNQVYLVWP